MIILPCYNPEEQWQQVVAQNFLDLTALCPTIQFQLAIVNDGSTTDLSDALSYLKSRIPQLIYYELEKNTGKGFSIRYAVERQIADFYLYTDIDFPYIKESMVNMIEMLGSNKMDFVIGIRDHAYYEKIPAVRRSVSKVLKAFNRLFFKLVTDDTQCGLKSFSYTNGRAIFLQTKSNRYLFDLELIQLLSKRKDLQVSLCQVQLRNDVQLSRLKLKSLFGELFNYLKLMLR